ncbi:uncharacterized protein LOC144357885 isoform X2 [Saccoglossus kowalevskii]
MLASSVLRAISAQTAVTVGRISWVTTSPRLPKRIIQWSPYSSNTHIGHDLTFGGSSLEDFIFDTFRNPETGRLSVARFIKV